jgi:NAD(P)H-hydrate epimerase
MHKYSRGHVVVASGPAHATGAARLAAAGALRIGAGAVTVASPPDAVAVNASQLTAVMVRPVCDAHDLAALLAARQPTAAVLGPGNGVNAWTRDIVEAALTGEAALVLDADALTCFAGEAERLASSIGKRAAPVVLTPHEGEFARLFGGDGPRIDRARSASRESGAIVVLKGADTVIAAPDGRLAINANAPPDLATAGSGDVLAGMIAGLLAQGAPAFHAAAAGVWMHGAAGATVGRGLIAEDLPGALPHVFMLLDEIAKA